MNADPDQRTGHDLVLSCIAAAATVLVLPVIVVAGDFAPWMLVVTAVAAAAVYARRDSLHGLAALGATALMWIASSPGALSAWSVAVALLMLITHLCLALQTTAPPGAELGREVALRWLRRTAVVALLTALVYLLALALQNLHTSDAEVVLALTLALLGGLILLLRLETLEAQQQPPPRDPSP